MYRKKVLAISGSTRKDSSNLQIIRAIARLGAGSDTPTLRGLEELVTAFTNELNSPDQ